MRIASKLNIVVLAVLAASVAANYAVLKATIQPRFDDIELTAAAKNHDRVLEAIGSVSEALRASAQDYAFWDSCYQFALGNDVSEFVASTLTPAPKMLENVSVDAAVFLDRERRVLWAAGIDGSSGTSLVGLVPDLLGVKYRHPYLTDSGPVAVTSGLVHTHKGLALVAVAPIVKGDHTGEPAGVVLMAKLLREAKLQDITGVYFATAGVSPETELLPQHRRVRKFQNAVETASVIVDIDGRPIAKIKSHTPRDLSKAGAAAINSAVLLMLLAASMVIMVLWLFVRWVVVSRIVALKDHFSSAVESGRICESKSDNAADEIGEMARAFNRMATHVNDMRDAIADSAYLSGVSEWAAGTLHNVRNALTPINMYALKVQDLFDERWRTNMRTALAQIELVGIEPERREKLTSYLLASSHRMLACADQTYKISDRIIATSKTIEEIVGEYENFGVKDTQVLPIELREIVDAVAKSVFEGRNADVQLEITPHKALVCANRTIVRQIVSNLFVNAQEAMQNQKREKRVRIEIETFDDEGRVELHVTDNGEGIAADQLRAVFERGFSTRRNKKGGLGLHWCANAAKAMGGSLHAASDGPGTGATLVLCLPALTAERDLEEAA